MIDYSQPKAERNAAARDRRREVALRSRLRDMSIAKREAETQLDAARKRVFKRNGGWELLRPLEPAHALTDVQKATIAAREPVAVETKRCTNPAHDNGHACGAPFELGEEAYAGTRECYRLLDALRPFSRPRTAACRRKRIAQSVQVFSDGKGCTIQGVCSCGNANGCPVCARRIYTVRANEIEYMISRWIGSGPERRGGEQACAGMLTLTIAHGDGDDLGRISRGVNEAWRRMFQGRSGQALKKRLCISHFVRAQEQTHGGNGWHPHLHSLLMHSEPPSAEALEDCKQAWRQAVIEVLGEAHAPDITGPGCDYKRIHESSDGKYVAKMGLEIAGIYIKKAKGGNRTYWQIARDAADGDRYAQHLWKDAQTALFRTKMLTWSNGTRAWFELADLTDEELCAEGEELTPPPLAIERYRLEVPSGKWDDACRRDRFFVSRLVGSVMAAETSGDWSGVLPLVERRSLSMTSCLPFAGGGSDEPNTSPRMGSSGFPRSCCHSTTPSQTSLIETT